MKINLQKGSAQLAIIVVLVIALIGALGFVFYQNFIENKNSVSNIIVEKTNKTADKQSTLDESSAEVATSTEQKTPTVSPTVVVNDFLTSYFSYISQEGHSDVAFANQSSVLTDAFKDTLNNLTVATVDHFLLTQDIPNSFTVGAATTTASNSNVSVTVNVATTHTNIIYNLILVNNEWKIDGVTRA